jgi:hypothetical protein
MNLVRIVVQEMPFHPDLQARFREAVLSPVLVKVGAALDRFKAMGQLADLPNGTIARLCAVSMMGYVAARLLNRSSPAWNDEAELEATIAFLLKGLAP